LIEKGILKQEESRGRSTNYELTEEWRIHYLQQLRFRWVRGTNNETDVERNLLLLKVSDDSVEPDNIREKKSLWSSRKIYSKRLLRNNIIILSHYHPKVFKRSDFSYLLML
jgi:hypothetical protein